MFDIQQEYEVLRVVLPMAVAFGGFFVMMVVVASVWVWRSL